MFQTRSSWDDMDFLTGEFKTIPFSTVLAAFTYSTHVSRSLDTKI